MIDKYDLAEKASIMVDGIKTIETFSDAVIDADSIPVDSQKTSSSLFTSALESDFNSKQELDTKKVVAAALIIAKKIGKLPNGIPENIGGIEAASISDETISRMKVAYQVSKGNIDVYEAADKLIDIATARMLAVSDKVVEKGVALAVDHIGMRVAKCFPPARPVVVVAKLCQPYITQQAQELVKKGIGKLNTIAKKTIRKVGETINKNKVSAKSRSKFKLFS